MNVAPPQSGVLVLAAVALLLGLGVLLLGPYLASRFSRQEQGRSLLLLWARIWLIDLIACVLLFTAVNAFKWLPFLPIALKVGVIVAASLVFSLASSLLMWQRRGGA
jgi:MFS family permease